ncbi:hypothetical protein GALL_395350 [mine drainage metagenome]|uniref:Uncharacterized protein n=1 Tax=mine drainage metagenome TaxID=410659 RepID=A0A1J5Q4Y0_9ZZZZ
MNRHAVATLLAATVLLSTAHAASCTPVATYKARVNQALLAYRTARKSLVDDIKLARGMNMPTSSASYAKWNAADARAARAEDAYTNLARLQGTYADALSCHTRVDQATLQPYLYALTNLEIAGNLLDKARGDLIVKCNSALRFYMPYFHAADQAVSMARRVAAGKVKSAFPSDYIAEEPDELANMREVPRMCAN